MINVLLAGVGGQGTVLAAKVLAQAALARGWQVRTAETIGMAQRGGNVTSHVRMGSEGEEVFSSLITPGTADMVIALEPGEAARALPYLAPGGVLVTATTAIQPVTAALASQPYRAGDVVAALENALQKNAVQEQQAQAEREAAFGVGAGDASVGGAGASTTDGTREDAARKTAGASKVTGTSRAAGEGETAGAGEDALAPGVGGYPVPLFVPVNDEALVTALGSGSRKSLNMMLLAVAVAQNRISLTLDEVKQAVEACVKPQFVAMNLEAIDHAAQAYG